MKKQLTALVLCICMVLSVLPFSSTQAAAEETSSVGTSNISIGDYIRLGNYNGQPILWRCVDVDEMGPLMLSDQVLATMAYDAKTSENSATRSHSRNLKRGTYGSNQWRDSNMRSWLNSKAEAGKVQHDDNHQRYVHDHMYLVNQSQSYYDVLNAFLVCMH